MDGKGAETKVRTRVKSSNFQTDTYNGITYPRTPWPIYGPTGRLPAGAALLLLSAGCR